MKKRLFGSALGAVFLVFLASFNLSDAHSRILFFSKIECFSADQCKINAKLVFPGQWDRLVLWRHPINFDALGVNSKGYAPDDILRACNIISFVDKYNRITEDRGFDCSFSDPPEVRLALGLNLTDAGGDCRDGAACIPIVIHKDNPYICLQKNLGGFIIRNLNSC